MSWHRSFFEKINKIEKARVLASIFKIVSMLILAAFIINICTSLITRKPVIEVDSNKVKLGYITLFSSYPQPNNKFVKVGVSYNSNQSSFLKNRQQETENYVPSSSESGVQYNINDSDHIGNLISQNSLFLTILFTVLGFGFSAIAILNWRKIGQIEKQWYEYNRVYQRDKEQRETFNKIRRELLRDPDLESQQDVEDLRLFSKLFCDDKKEEALKFFFAGKHIQPKMKGAKRLKRSAELYNIKELDQLKYALDYYNIAEQKFPFNDSDSKEIRRCIYVYKANVFKELGNHYFYKKPSVTKEYYFQSLKLYQRAIECDPYNIQAYNNKGNVLIKTFDLAKLDIKFRQWFIEELEKTTNEIFKTASTEANLLDVILDEALECFETVLESKELEKQDYQNYLYNFSIANLKKVEKEIIAMHKNITDDELKDKMTSIKMCDSAFFSQFINLMKQTIEISVYPAQKMIFAKKLEEDDDLAIFYSGTSMNAHFEAMLKNFIS